MKIDPTAVFFHTVASLPLRMVLLWLMADAGALFPMLMGGGPIPFDVLVWQVLFFPFHMALIILWSGWWGLVAVPSFLVLLWRSWECLKDEVSVKDLLWISLLSSLVAIKTSGDAWPWAVVLVGAAISAMVWIQRRDDGAILQS